MSRRWGQLCLAVVASVALMLGNATPAHAEWQCVGPEWSENDPVFVIDGRTVQVKAYVPNAYATAPLHYVLFVGRETTTTWSLPPGESLNGGSVTVLKTNGNHEDNVRLVVASSSPVRFEIGVEVSGAGLRGPTIQQMGTSRGMTLAFQLAR